MDFSRHIKRRGTALPLALLVCAIVFVYLLASMLTTSQSLRNVERSAELARVVEVGQSALLEAASALSDSLAPGAKPLPGSTDWRKELTPPYGSRGHPTGEIAPALIGNDADGLKVSPVACTVLHWWDSPQMAGGTINLTAPSSGLPGGILELVVDVRTIEAPLSAHRQLRRRHVFWGTIQAMPTGGALVLSPGSLGVRMDIRPLATVILQ